MHMQKKFTYVPGNLFLYSRYIFGNISKLEIFREYIKFYKIIITHFPLIIEVLKLKMTNKTSCGKNDSILK